MSYGCYEPRTWDNSALGPFKLFKRYNNFDENEFHWAESADTSSFALNVLTIMLHGYNCR